MTDNTILISSQWFQIKHFYFFFHQISYFCRLLCEDNSFSFLFLININPWPMQISSIICFEHIMKWIKCCIISWCWPWRILWILFCNLKLIRLFYFRWGKEPIFWLGTSSEDRWARGISNIELSWCCNKLYLTSSVNCIIYICCTLIEIS